MRNNHIFRIFGLVVFTGLAFALLPASTFAAPAATIGQHQQAHLFFSDRQTMAAVAAAGTNLNYGGGAVMAGTMKVYSIFWEPTRNVSANYQSLINRYFTDVNGSPLYNNNTQYTDSSGGAPTSTVLAGTWVDTTAYPETPLFDSDIQSEVTHAQNVNGWSSSIDTIFFVFLEAHANLCIDSTHCANNSFCAYHNYFGTNTIYAAMPYAASFSCRPPSSPNGDDADQTINVTSHEQMEAATDPLLSAWFDSAGAEIGDKCAWQFGPLNASAGDVTWNGHSYIIQKEWDNAISGCTLSGP